MLAPATGTATVGLLPTPLSVKVLSVFADLPTCLETSIPVAFWYRPVPALIGIDAVMPWKVTVTSFERSSNPFRSN